MVVMALPDVHAIAAGLLIVLDESMLGESGPSTYFVDNRPASGLLGAVSGLSASDASAPVNGQSIAAHVHHVVFAMDASASWIQDDRSGRDWEESWRLSTVNETEWATLVATLRNSHNRLRHAIQSEALDSNEAFTEAVGAIAHIAYHLGAVWQKLAILRNADRVGST
jgi:hypothetical protein